MKSLCTRTNQNLESEKVFTYKRELGIFGTRFLTEGTTRFLYVAGREILRDLPIMMDIPRYIRRWLFLIFMVEFIIPVVLEQSSAASLGVVWCIVYAYGCLLDEGVLLFEKRMEKMKTWK